MTHPEFRQLVLRDHQVDLDQRARRAYLRRPSDVAPAVADEPVVLRLCSVHDDAALERLAELEQRPVPTGRFIVAEVHGVVVAALPLCGGAPLSDPFRATAHLFPLLELRARQLAPDGFRRGRIAAWSAVRGWSRA